MYPVPKKRRFDIEVQCLSLYDSQETVYQIVNWLNSFKTFSLQNWKKLKVIVFQAKEMLRR